LGPGGCGEIGATRLRPRAPAASDCGFGGRQADELHLRVREVEALLETEGRRHAEAEARWRDDRGALAEAEARRQAEVGHLRTSDAAQQAAPAPAAVDPAYGGEYLARIVGLLEQGKESAAANASRADELSRQVCVLRRLEAAISARGREDLPVLRAGGPAGGAGGHGAGAEECADSEGLFDARVDDDEVLLRLFREVDADGSGTVSMAELLTAPLLSKRESAEIARALRRAVGCDVGLLEEALAWVEEADLACGVATSPWGQVKGRSTAVKAIFDAVAGSRPAAANVDAAAARGACEWATRAHFERFLASPEGPAQGSALATALKSLAEVLPSDGQELDFLAVKAAARKVPRVAAQRLEWVRSMGLDAALARHLSPGTLDDGCVESRR
jgi:hypothetical protein